MSLIKIFGWPFDDKACWVSIGGDSSLTEKDLGNAGDWYHVAGLSNRRHRHWLKLYLSRLYLIVVNGFRWTVVILRFPFLGMENDMT